MRRHLFIIGLFCSQFLINCSQDLPKEIELAYQEIPEVVDFNYDVKPILSDKCFVCHGPDQKNRKADLRLDSREGAYRALGDKSDHYAIVPGKPFKSHVVKRILSKDKEFMMPPPESNLTLSNEQIAIITKWIKQGASFKPHWSLIKPEKHLPPEVSNAEWPKNSIDFFTLHKIEQKGLTPSERAKRETLIRRLSFDLIGLPPTRQDIEYFVHDDSSNAYEKLVDRLLDSPAYGERMAMEWMDVARYADSDGYLDDKHRDFSPWRD